MELKKSFAAAAAKFPERERRTALAAFVARYSQPWPISNYRCTGKDILPVEEFLKGCGFDSGDYAVVTSAREPGSAMIRWTTAVRIQKLCGELMASLPDDAARLALYRAQSSSGDAAPGLRDDPEAKAGGPDGFWDPLGLVARTEEIAEACTGSEDSAVASWAKKYLAKGRYARPVTAPLWVLERITPGGLGLFRACERSGSGRTAGVPFSVGRYVKPDEPLVPLLPTLASMPVLNLVGESRGDSPLDGFMTMNVGDLTEVPHDDGRTMWLHVEDAYVQTSLRGAEKVKALAEPSELWPYVTSLYAKAYGCDVTEVPGQCFVHVGPKYGKDEFRGAAISAFDREVMDGNMLDVRPCLVFSPAGTATAKAKIAVSGAHGFRWAGEPEDGPAPSDAARVRDYEDAAAEWFAMTHAGEGTFTPSLSAPNAGSGALSADALRAACGPEGLDAKANAVPTELSLDENDIRWRAPAHVSTAVIEDVRHWLDCEDFVDPSSIKWSGPDRELHTAGLAVPAMYSVVRLSGRVDADDLFVHHKPEEVTKALCAFADPKRQLAMPDAAGDLLFDLVVETNVDCRNSDEVRFCLENGRLHSTTTASLKNMFLHALQNNVGHDSPQGGWNNLETGCDYRTHKAMMEALRQEFGGRTAWSALWGDRTRASSGHREYDLHNGQRNRNNTWVLALMDSFGRLVLVFRMAGPSAAVSRATFRWCTGLPVASDRTAATLRSLAKGPTVDPGDPDALMTLVREQTSSGGAVPRWTSWLGPSFGSGECGLVTPNDDVYRHVAVVASVQPFTAKDVVS